MPGICMLTHSTVRKWVETGVRPDCDYHWHQSYKIVDAMVRNDEAIWIPNQRAAIVFPCVLSYQWKGKLSGCTRVMQMVPVGT